jgi:hypothetical protein
MNPLADDLRLFRDSPRVEGYNGMPRPMEPHEPERTMDPTVEKAPAPVAPAATPSLEQALRTLQDFELALAGGGGDDIPNW